MRKPLRIILIAGLAVILCFMIGWFIKSGGGKGETATYEAQMKEKYGKGPGGIPADWFMVQRTFPGETLNVSAYREALAKARQMRAAYQPIDEAVWEEAGPSNIGGRVTALGVHQSAPNVVFAGAADGGVLKSVDGGDSWTPVFDEEGAQSIGAITVDPNDPNTVWVGTGEANSSGDSYPGDGIYRSTDCGDTWEHIGLENSYHIGRIAIDPTNSQRIFAAVAGALWGTNPERGIYRSEDGGVNWERVLHITDSTAAIDVVINPQNPQIIYAAMWERIRHSYARTVGGVTSGIWRSINGGDDWELLTEGLPAAAPDVGRIGLTISPNHPNILYSIYCDHPGDLMGVWRTEDGGDNWVETNSPGSSLLSSFGWYFGNIYVDPVDPRRVFVLGVPLKCSVNGGDSWTNESGGMHVDHHAFWINPDNSDQIYDGNDGGVYYSNNGGEDWTKCYDLHISQFYANEIDYLLPDRLYGGTQDNGTLRTLTGALDDWVMILGGDGFYSIVDYTDSDIIFAEYQWGSLKKSIDCGGYFSSCLDGVDSDDRRNWSTPVAMDPVNPDILYYGTYRLYQTIDQADEWEAISGDLTAGIPSGYTFHTITTIAVAPTNTEVIYVGADDGNVWVTQNTGHDWTLISEELPERWITRVAVSPQDEAIVYVTISGYRWNEFLPHIFRSVDFGANWDDISGNLPEAPVNVIIEDPEYPQRLYVGTDVGAYYSENLGAEWQALGSGLPICTVSDMKLHNPSRILAAGTHGRSMYKMELDSLVAGVEYAGGGEIPAEFRLFAPSPNPFNAATKISFALPAASDVSLVVYDAVGREVVTLIDGFRDAGTYSVRFDGSELASGVYFARLILGNFNQTKKLVLIK